MIGMLSHRAKFVNEERAKAFSHALLLEKHGAFRVAFDHERNEHHHRRKQYQAQKRQDDIECAFDHKILSCSSRTAPLHRDKNAVRDLISANFRLVYQNQFSAPLYLYVRPSSAGATSQLGLSIHLA